MSRMLSNSCELSVALMHMHGVFRLLLVRPIMFAIRGALSAPAQSLKSFTFPKHTSAQGKQHICRQ